MDTKEINRRLILLGSYARIPILVAEVDDVRESEYPGDGPVWEIFRQGTMMGTIQVLAGQVHYHPSMKYDWRYDVETLAVLHLMVATIRENL